MCQNAKQNSLLSVMIIEMLQQFRPYVIVLEKRAFSDLIHNWPVV